VGDLPAGHDTITVVIRTTNSGVTAFATHVDCCSLFGVGPIEPVLVAAPAFLAPCARQNSNPPDDALTVYNAGGGTLNYTLTPDEAWVSVAPASGTSRGEPDMVTVGYAATGMRPGTYNATITVSAPGALYSPLTIAATLTVTAVPPDFSRDGDVDLGDFARFQGCFNGPNRPYRSGCAGRADFDTDRDVDLDDFAVFQACYNGPNTPPACE
jgi:hypothetical protein